jgi:hypothetical protein
MSSNPFDTANLSPLAIPPRPIPLPYGLTWDDLRSILAGFAQDRAAAAQAFIAYEKQGLHGGPNSCILTLRYPDPDGAFRSEVLFVKHVTNPAQFEAARYRYLAAQSLSLPCLLGAFHRSGAETICLEFLPQIGIDFRDANEVDSLLHLLAQLNSLPGPGRLFDPLPGMPQDEFDAGVLAALDYLAQRLTLTFQVDAPRWCAAYQKVRAARKFMPRGLNHNEFSFQQVGWVHRGADRELVLFDLETMSLAPRFSDIAGLLCPLAAYTGRDEVALFEVYLERLRQLQRVELPLADALRELRLTRACVEFESLPWYASELRQNGDPGVISGAPMRVACLHNDLMTLGLL